MYSKDISPRILRLDEYVLPGEYYYVGRRASGATFQGRLHTHADFAELTWIEQGELQHLVNGDRQRWQQGDVVFLRPHDVHRVRPVADVAFTQVTVSFPSETLESLQQRYFADGPWAWSADGLPRIFRLDAVQLDRLRELASLLVAGPPTRLRLERFLLELLCDLIAPPQRSDLPDWLTGALRQLADQPGALGRGVSALSDLAGRSREHVNRVIRESTGQTATELINELRLARAAAQLRMTDRPVARVAGDCGIPNLSHFYRLFKDRYRLTPRQYRLMSTVSGYRPTRTNGD
ncbi:AraC family transcriptional regulator [Microlunatus speluncae]|uniref:AraC family transcriptional regulator n=1 Tax=Microlunatus speluncae TaxID=2594267 RepID=UPI0012667A08|nr:AraC family transcriptional regulator [Microlunatus speluncae]